MSRERVLTDEEIRRLWRFLCRQPTTAERAAPGRKRSKGTADDPICPVAPALADAIKMRLLTAQRGGEVIKMRWQDLDLKTGWWTIPGEFAKNGRAHRVPLSRTRSRSSRRNRRTTTSSTEDKTTRKDDKHRTSSCSSAAARRSAIGRRRRPSRIARVLKFDFRGHDLRRTAATKMAEAGVPRQHISAVLNHVEGGASVTRVYDRYSYDAEKRRALETWARKLRAIVEAARVGQPAFISRSLGADRKPPDRVTLRAQFQIVFLLIPIPIQGKVKSDSDDSASWPQAPVRTRRPQRCPR